jgi:hypothetical protein
MYGTEFRHSFRVACVTLPNGSISTMDLRDWTHFSSSNRYHCKVELVMIRWVLDYWPHSGYDRSWCSVRCLTGPHGWPPRRVRIHALLSDPVSAPCHPLGSVIESYTDCKRAYLTSIPIAAVVYGAILSMAGNLTGMSILEADDLCSNLYRIKNQRSHGFCRTVPTLSWIHSTGGSFLILSCLVASYR